MSSRRNFVKQTTLDAAARSAITPLSEASIENNGEPQDFPDFSRGM